jgi:hypothetical protein
MTVHRARALGLGILNLTSSKVEVEGKVNVYTRSSRREERQQNRQETTGMQEMVMRSAFTAKHTDSQLLAQQPARVPKCSLQRHG